MQIDDDVQIVRAEPIDAIAEDRRKLARAGAIAGHKDIRRKCEPDEVEADPAQGGDHLAGDARKFALHAAPILEGALIYGELNAALGDLQALPLVDGVRASALVESVGGAA